MIYKSEVDLIAGRWAVSGYKDAEERAAQYLLKREALYHEALRQGYSATDEEAQEIVDSELETGKMSTNYDEFQAFLEEAELTDEAYWQAQHGLFKKELIISRYTEPIREAYAEEKGLQPADNEAWEGWDEYLQKIADKLIKQDHVKKVAS